MDSIAQHILNPKPDEFVVGYAACHALFMPQGENTPEDYWPPMPLTNPFAEGTQQWEGFEQAFYDFTQK